jgi:protein SCO1/2
VPPWLGARRRCQALPGRLGAAPGRQVSDQQGRPSRWRSDAARAAGRRCSTAPAPTACPLLIDSGKGVEHALSAAERAQLRLLYLSIDPARDDTKKLAALAAKRKLDPARWTLARTDEAGVRRTAAVLGVRYRKLANGEFNHSSVLILLDRDGRVWRARRNWARCPDPAFVAKVKAALAKA